MPFQFMIILSSLDSYPVFYISTPWGYERVISYGNKFYVCMETYKLLEDAIADCQTDLDTGFTALVVQEQPQVASLWCCLPQNLQANLQNSSHVLADSVSSYAINRAKVENRSWLNLVLYIRQISQFSANLNMSMASIHN